MDGQWTKARSKEAQAALSLVEALQQRLGEHLSDIATNAGDAPPILGRHEWLRNDGKFGGGHRLGVAPGAAFNRASINVSQVQYEDAADRPLNSATALSTIVHPANPHAPSVHIHISYTELKQANSYWRIMADLNPSIIHEVARQNFGNALAAAAGAHWALGKEQGERYFFIPALGRHRGILHFYLENFHSGDFKADLSYAEQFGCRVIDAYATVVRDALQGHGTISDADRKAQLAYHTLYFFQVLTLDRGTISGLMVHDENDVGIMGSLPSHVDKDLLSSWRDAMVDAQRPLLDALLSSLPDEKVAMVDDPAKKRLAEAIRRFYKAHPDAVDHLARGDVLPTTTANHS